MEIGKSSLQLELSWGNVPEIASLLAGAITVAAGPVVTVSDAVDGAVVLLVKE
jgi:hypothetical protein